MLAGLYDQQDMNSSGLSSRPPGRKGFSVCWGGGGGYFYSVMTLSHIGEVLVYFLSVQAKTAKQSSILEKDKAGLSKLCYADWSSLLAENRTTDSASAKPREWDAHKSADPQSVSAPSFTPCVSKRL